MKRLKLIFTLVLLLYFVSFNSNMNYVKLTDVTVLKTPETQKSTFSVADSTGPIIGLPSIDILNPNSDEDVQVTGPIQDVDGVRNATLFWQYTTVNNTMFNSTVTIPNNQRFINRNNYNFPETGYITGSGEKTIYPSDWVYGEYIFSESAVTQINILIEVGLGNPAVIVYNHVQAKNITTGLWQTVLEDGGCGKTSAIDSANLSYANTGLTLGYRIFTVTYRAAGDPAPPRFDDLDIWRDEYYWIIPAVGRTKASFVDYYITTFDDLNQSTTSPTYTFLMDYAPIITFAPGYYPPSTVKGDEEIKFTVRVEDPDGYETINKTSVFVYYWFSGSTDITKIDLVHYYDDPLGGSYSPANGYQYFNGTIPSGNIQNNETELYFRVNASDIVAGTRGREGRSTRQTVWVDSLNPRVIPGALTVDGGVNIAGLGLVRNTSLVDVSVNITVSFYDQNNVSSVAIYYSMPNGTTPIKLLMQNTSVLDQFRTFNVSLPMSNETMFVEYFFETEDSLGNNGTTSLGNFYYSDGSGPILDTFLIYPPVINNYTDVLVLFNATDLSFVIPPDLYFKVENQSFWAGPIGATPIDYATDIEDQEPFTATNLHYIKNNAISSFPLEVIRTIPVDGAILTFDITHEMSTDLRVWLKLDDGRKFMLYDREPGLTTFSRSIDLFKLGLTEDDFTRGNFTLEIQDFSELYSGSVTKYEIELIDYTYPVGYQFYVRIPATLNDTAVSFYINMTDRLGNSENTTVYEYYSDGVAPSISVIPLTSPVNLAGAHYVRINANIEDKGGIFGVDTYYRYNEGDDWSLGAMSFNSTSGFYFFDIPVHSESGTVSFKIRAYDLSGLSSETSIYTISYSQALGPYIEILGIPYPSPLDMNGTSTIRVWANVTDFDGNVTECTIWYRFSDADEWEIKNMILDEETGYYYYDIKVYRSGNLTIIVNATDNLGLSQQSDPYTIWYVNAGSAPGLPPELVLFGAIIAIGGGGSVAAVILYKKGKLKLPDRFRRGG
ncbi:MAG: hypothetical protein ACFFAE_13165 [Candidatus Hodarchaeota archaeon]